MMDQFFDALNVHNYTHGIHARKEFQMPYVSAKSKRLKVHIGNYYAVADYFGWRILDEWENAVKERAGEYTKTQRNMMLQSPQTRLGLRVTCKSASYCIGYNKYLGMFSLIRQNTS